jgi:hypothetical protein
MATPLYSPPNATGMPNVQSRYPHSRRVPWLDFFRRRLEGVRLLVLQGERVANPDFYPILKTLGFNNRL